MIHIWRGINEDDDVNYHCVGTAWETGGASSLDLCAGKDYKAACVEATDQCRIHHASCKSILEDHYRDTIPLLTGIIIACIYFIVMLVAIFCICLCTVALVKGAHDADRQQPSAKKKRLQNVTNMLLPAPL